MIYLRSALFNFVFYSTFIIMMIVGLPLILAPRGAALWLVRVWARISVPMLRLICGMRVEFRNLELLPKGASIIAVKHQSFLETFALITVLDDFSYILKKELTKVPFFGWYVWATEQISIDRDKRGGAVALLQRAVREKLAAGRQIVIFPEGTRRPVGVPAAYKSGVSALCAAARMPCTPVALNTGLFWPRRSFVKQPGCVVFEFLPPISPDLEKAAFMRELENAIEPATDALVAEARSRDPHLGRPLTKETPAPA